MRALNSSVVLDDTTEEIQEGRLFQTGIVLGNLIELIISTYIGFKSKLHESESESESE